MLAYKKLKLKDITWEGVSASFEEIRPKVFLMPMTDGLVEDAKYFPKAIMQLWLLQHLPRNPKCVECDTIFDKLPHKELAHYIEVFWFPERNEIAIFGYCERCAAREFHKRLENETSFKKAIAQSRPLAHKTVQ